VAQGETHIVNVANLRIKESNRLAAVVTELRRVGIVAEELPAGLRIRGGEPHGADIETYSDHRIAMSMALAGLRVPGVTILDPDCVNKTYPDYWRDMASLGVAMKTLSNYVNHVAATPLDEQFASAAWESVAQPA
jgi:3-phosphoshikimate 1-carboxyvinyltransferase